MSYGKKKGLVTDDLVLKKIFNNQYDSWGAFKKAMYKERQNQFSKLNHVKIDDPSQHWSRQTKKKIIDIQQLQTLMNEAVLKDLNSNGLSELYYDTNSAVHKLKKAIFKAYLDQTKDFRTSIFESKK